MDSLIKQDRIKRSTLNGIGALCFAVLGAAPALAGAGSSGGAFQLKDTLNPWFLQNTAKISYCIDLDPATFSASHEEAVAAIETAYRYWQAEFANAHAWTYQDMEPTQFKVATQTLEEVACGSGVDLRFQLGKMTPTQVAAIDQPEDTIAVTVRTAYDRVKMHGQGFIYVAADKGQAVRTPRVTDGIWRAAQGSLLTNTLAHELGHVFGMPDSGFGWRLMTYDYIAKLLSAQTRWTPADNSQDIPETMAFAVAPWPFAWGWQESEGEMRKSLWAANVFGIELASHGEIKCTYANDKLSFASAKWTGKHRDWIPLATADLQGTWRPGETLISVWLPPERETFKFRTGPHGPIVPDNTTPVAALADKVRHLQGSYTAPHSGVRTLFNFDVNPRQWPPRVAAYVDGKLYADFFAAAMSNDPELNGAP